MISELEREIGMLLRENRGGGGGGGDDREIYRSGSAPPTIQGSLSAVGGLFGGPTTSSFSEFARAQNGTGGNLSEEELRADPAYLQYYYSNVNLNPRLPPPLLSKEDWRFAQRLQQGGSSGLGGIGDGTRRISGVSRTTNENGPGPGRSLFSMPPGFGAKREERELDPEKVPAPATAEWVKDGLPGIGLGSKQKSLAEIFQDDLGRSNPPSRHPSRPASRNAFEENTDSLSSAEAELSLLLRESANVRVSAQNLIAPTSATYASALGSSPLSRSTTPDPQHIARALSPCPTPIGEGRAGAASKKTASHPSLNGISLARSQSADLVAALSAMNMASKNGNIDTEKHNYLFNGHGTEYSYLKKSESGHLHMPGGSQPTARSNLGGVELRNPQVERPKSALNSGVPYSNGASLNGSRLSPQYPTHLDGIGSSVSNYGLGGFSLNSMMGNQPGNFNLPPLLENTVGASAMGIPGGLDSRVLGSGLPSGQGLTSGNALQNSVADAMYLQYLRTAEYAALAQAAALGNHSAERYYMDMDLLQKAYLGSMPLQKPQFSDPLGSKSGGSNHGLYGNQAFEAGMRYPGSQLTTGMRNLGGGGGGGGGMGSWHTDGSYGSSLLEEFKSNKTKCFELSEIAGHVVEFSADQYGSRFIQQKLETATTEEKNMVFEEIYPHALSLMTDVFGNYVIQKFFEHGMDDQRRELAKKLDGHVLTLSLQMYGCRVIQKAIEVVDLDQKIKMVQELDGHIMRCVRDQNGNHVIQKCIECVPEEHIHFIVESFFDQVVTLSTHPYGCRVIQRVLEHCKDPETQDKVMDEILGSVSMLAQDQYGNYVVQHVLEHGKPHERTAIIKELAGKIVQMSQQKFASNVVEKCLAFGNAEERELLVNEMLGTTDENEPLQAMMKDQFANYVVQKVLETCSDQQREHILARIKVHLNALKKYTYGKHIVARVEKLVAAGERRSAGQTAQPA